MVLKDKFKNRITVYQARSGRLIMPFANNKITLNKEQAETLVGSSVYDIEDFDKEAYMEAYNN